MKTTARNQFPGKITQVQSGPITTQVTLTLGGGQEITAALTSGSATAMKLSPGQEALALVKSSAVVLVTDFAGYTLSARNQLAGTISRIDKGGVSTVVGLDLPGGGVVGDDGGHRPAALGLQVGQAATAVFKAYAVMLAVKAP